MEKGKDKLPAATSGRQEQREGIMFRICEVSEQIKKTLKKRRRKIMLF